MSVAREKLLIVDDDSGIQRQLKWAFDAHDVLLAGNREDGVSIARKESPQVVLLDLAMPPDLEGPSEGFAALEALLSLDPKIRVIIASGNDEHENAVKAIGMGAYDFCSKPVDLDLLRLIVDRAFQLYDLEAENERLSHIADGSPMSGLITGNGKILKLCQAVEQVANSTISVMFTGESGTGKEVLARALHNASPRAEQPFIAINCAAIPENLLESELFGHEKGAFTGAVKQTVGKFEQADKGTLFLDEIAEMAAPLQAKLLRFLQDRTIERIGGRTSIEVDVRIVSATNRDLKQEMEAGRFREDLFYRLNEVSFELPPLRERDGDAVLIAKYFIKKYNPSLGTSVKGLAPDAANAIANYDWPGNVRELENRIKRSMVLCDGRTIRAEDLDIAVEKDALSTFPTLRQVREQAERDVIIRALSVTQDNVSKAAKLLGVSRPTLYELMKSLGLKT